MAENPFRSHLSSLQAMIENSLRGILAGVKWPQALKNAVEYSLLAGGKRLRPALVLLANDVCGGDSENAIPAACAVEMVHTYSLIHDDLPCMDDDDFRRGRPTSHKVFGEALAVLAGDCLLTLAFETIASVSVNPAGMSELVRLLALAGGGGGMVGGQVLDLEAERGAFPGMPGVSEDSVGIRSNQSVEKGVEQLIRIHRMKTGALIAGALEIGAVTAGADGHSRDCLRLYGHCVGLAFQIADDLLDVTGESSRMGKTPGRDADLGKLTYPGLLGVDDSRRRAEQLVNEACDSLSIFGDRGVWLKELAGFIVKRDH